MKSKNLFSSLGVVLALALLVIAISPSALRGSLPTQQTGSWIAGTPLSEALSAATATVMYDGRVLIAGGTGTTGEPLSSVEIVGLDGSIAPAAPMHIARSGHAAVWLFNGYVLVTGGTTVGGGVTNTAEMYDPLHDTWTLLPAVMADPRSGHTATNLLDGSVLITGGNNGTSALASVETFSIVNEQFQFAGAMISAREHHAAAALADGRVAILGGSNADGLALASSEIFDPETNSLTAGPALNSARAAATATALLDGSVLIAGGRNADGELASLEVIDADAIASRTLPTAMSIARAEHVAVRLADNNQVLLVGGTSAGAVINTVDIYTPWTGELKPAASMQTARANAASANLAVAGRAMVAGGNTDATELYAFATVKTDRTDYLPGMTVQITGAGWVPGETVALNLVSNGVVRMSSNVTANAFGEISDSTFAPTGTDLNALFYLTATGSQSQAQTSFTDGTLTVMVVGAGSVTGSTYALSPATCTAAQTSGCTVSMQNRTNILTAVGNVQSWAVTSGSVSLTGCTAGSSTCTVGRLNGSQTATVTVTFGKSTSAVNTWPTASAITYGQSLASSTLSGGSATVGGTFAFTNPSTIPSASGAQSVTFTPTDTTNYNTVTGTVNVTVNPAPVVVSLSNLSQTYDGSAKTVTVATNPVGVATSVTYDGSSTAPTNAGTYTVAATVTAPNYTGSATASLEIKKASQTITFAALSDQFLYTRTISVGASSDSSLAVALSASGTCTVAGTTVTLTGIGDCTITANQPGNTNYEAATAVSHTFAVKAVTPTATWSAPAAIQYGTPLGAAQLSATVRNSGVDVAGTFNYSPAAGTVLASGTHTLSMTFTPDDEAYSPVSTTTTILVNKAEIAVTAASASRAYGEANPEFVAQYAGFVNSDTAAVITTPASCSTAATAASGVGPYAITCSGAVAANYDFTYTPGTLTVNKAALVVTPADAQKLSGDANPALTGTVTGIVNNDPITATYSTTATTTSPVGTYPITAVLSDGGTGKLANYLVDLKTATLTVADNRPDLAVAATLSTATVPSAGSLQVTDTISNIGASPTGALTAVRIYLLSGSTKMEMLSARYVASVAAKATLAPVNTTVTVPANLMGAYSIMVCTDDNFIVNEVDETNNCASQPITITAPDLTITAISGPASVPAGRTFTVTDTTANLGPAASTSSVIRYYLMRGTTAVLELGTRTVDDIPANSSAAPVIATLTMPLNTTGSYTILACVNEPANIVESNSTNNCMTTGAVVVREPDMAVSGVTVSATGLAGGTITVTDTTSNNGQGDAAATQTRYYLLSGSTAIASLGNRSVAPLAFGATTGSVQTTLTLPANITGVFTVQACADAYNAATESNESNNCAVSTGTLAVGGADMVVSAASAPATAVSGGTITITDTTSNIGGVSAKASLTRFYLVNGTTRMATLGTRSIAVLAGGTSSGPANSTFTLPSNLAGTYSVAVCADDYNAVTEDNENNNCMSTGTIAVAGADMVVSNITVPATGIAGTTISVSDTTANIGSAAAKASTTKFYLASGTTKLLSLGTRSVAALAPSASSGPVSTTLTLPATKLGTYSIMVCADDYSAVVESDETNNCQSSATITITK